MEQQQQKQSKNFLINHQSLGNSNYQQTKLKKKKRNNKNFRVYLCAFKIRVFL